jgi:hypothetical protein
MIVNRSPSLLSSPHSDISFLSSPDSFNLSQMSASDRSGVRFPKHKDFYLDDGNVIFLVDNTYFKVHRFFFQRDSQFFRDAFDRDLSPTGLYTAEELASFKDITSLDFERFLGVLYPKDFSKPTATTVDEWTSILDLSVRWDFESIQSLATEQLTLIASPIDKIVLGRKYHITKWLQDAYHAVCEREQSLTVEEGLRLGMPEVINISRARQAAREKATLAAPSRLHSIIEETFGLGVPLEMPHPSMTEPSHRDSDECEKVEVSDTFLEQSCDEAIPVIETLATLVTSPGESWRNGERCVLSEFEEPCGWRQKKVVKKGKRARENGTTESQSDANVAVRDDKGIGSWLN